MTPDPWLTFWLACGGLAASLASGFGAIWALTQKRRYLPKPLMICTAVMTDSGAEQFGAARNFSVVVENKGDGVAHDVHLYLCNETGVERELEHQTLRAHGEVIRYSTLLTDTPPEYDERGNLIEVSGTGPLVKVWARVTWRQAPRMDKVRERVIRP